jgi:Outer membrane protein beta-barrel domain
MRKLLLLFGLALGAGVARADNDALYVGAGISRDNLKDIAATNSDLNSTNWKVWAGFRPISVFAVEAGYIDLGSQDISTTGLGTSNGAHLDFKAFTGYAVGYLPIPDPILDVFVKAGVARWNSSGSLAPSSFSSLSDSGTQFAWGLGAQVHFGNFGARLEYENFDIRNTGGANIISLSAFLNFL